jgi:Fe2+ or Zn2+ uptake regulation protein
MSYFNTTSEQGIDMVHYTLTAVNQECIVLEIMKIHGSLSPSQVLSKYKIKTGKVQTPITSIRRALSVLTKAGQLEKTNKKMYANYGRKEHFWKVIKN